MITRYVNTASSAGGDGTTNATSGANRAYASLNEFEASEQAVLSDSIEAICEGSATDTAAVTVAGWTTTSSHYIKIHTTQANRHSGKWDTNKYRLVTTAKSLDIDEDYIKFYGLQVVVTSDVDTVDVDGDGCEIGYCIIGTEYASTQWRDTILCRKAGATLKIYNSVVWHDSSHGDATAVLAFNGCTVQASNVTAINRNAGGTGHVFQCYGASDILTLYNCIAVSGNSSAVAIQNRGGGTLNCNYCASDDGSADDHTGSNNQVDQTFTFVDAANKDYHLGSADAGAKNLGDSSDPNFSFSDDIDGDTRSGTWDIGADEYIAPTTTSAPTTVAPTTLTPTTSAPTSAAPTTLAPTTAAPADIRSAQVLAQVEWVEHVPTTAAPTTPSPTTGAPTTAAPTTLAPTTAAPPPTTLAPTTAAPTTSAPTTAAPTLAPTTVTPTTQAPTTPSPTTAAPTPVPTTLAPTTLAPTTSTLTTVAPTTSVPEEICVRNLNSTIIEEISLKSVITKETTFNGYLC